MTTKKEDSEFSWFAVLGWLLVIAGIGAAIYGYQMDVREDMHLVGRRLILLTSGPPAALFGLLIACVDHASIRIARLLSKS